MFRKKEKLVKFSELPNGTMFSFEKKSSIYMKRDGGWAPIGYPNWVAIQIEGDRDPLVHWWYMSHI